MCSDCKSKYINDEEHIHNDFGYTRLEERYKTCVKCRARKQIKNKACYEKHPEKVNQYYESHEEEAKECNKQYREKNADRLKEHDRVRSKVNVFCPNCDTKVCKTYLKKHQENEKCKSHVKPES